MTRISFLDPNAREKLLGLASSNPLLAIHGPGAEGVPCSECAGPKFRRAGGGSWCCVQSNAPRGEIWNHNPSMQSCAKYERRSSKA